MSTPTYGDVDMIEPYLFHYSINALKKKHCIEEKDIPLDLMELLSVDSEILSGNSI